MNKLSVRLDWLSVSLNDQLTPEEFYKLVDTPTWDEETGEQTGVWLNAWQWSSYAVGMKRTVISFYKGGELKGLELARKYNLVPTRLDLALDVPTKSLEKQNEFYQGICTTLEAYFLGRHIQPSITEFKGRERAENGKVGTRFWSQNSDKSLSVYLKRGSQNVVLTPGAQPTTRSVRLEWRLKNPHATLVFNAIKDGYPDDTNLLFNVWQSLNATFISPDIFGLGTYEQVDLTPAEDDSAEVSGRQWFEVQVLKAGIRWFKSTGEDIFAWLANEQARILQAEVEQQKTIVTSKAQKRQVALLHASGKKQDKIRRRVSRAMERDIAEAYRNSETAKEIAAQDAHFADM